jgi:hypothetical protein
MTEFPNKALDTADYVTKEIILKGVIGSPNASSVLDSFIANQTFLQSLNRMGGRIFNPIGFLANMFDGTKNIPNTFAQVFSKGVSDVLNQRGLYTTDGKTFGRFFNITNLVDLRLEEAKDFENTANVIKNSITGNQRSVLAQALAYDNVKNKSNIDDSIDDIKGSSISMTATQVGGLGDGAYSFIYGEPFRVQLNRLVDSGRTKSPAVFVRLPDGLFPNSNIRQPSSLSDVVNIFEGILNSRRIKITGGGTTPKTSTELKSEREYYSNSGSLLTNDFLEQRTKIVFELDNLPAIKRTSLQSALEVSDNYSREKDEVLRGIDTPKVKFVFKELNYQATVGTYKIVDYIRSSRAKGGYFSDFKDRLKDLDDIVNVSDIQDSTAFPASFQPNEVTFMRFTDLRTSKTVFLRPTFESINEDIQVQFDPISYVGRTENFQSYTSTGRSLSFSFKLYAQTPNEFTMMYKKLEFLKTLCYPIANNDFSVVQNPFVEISIGNIYKGVKGYLNTFSTTTSSEQTTWETETGYVAPRVLDCTISLIILHDSMPYGNINGNSRTLANNVRMHDIE